MLAAIAVTTTNDVVDAHDGLVSLREAVLQANSTAKPDTITLPAGTYTLTRAGAGEEGGLTGDLDIKYPLTINGAGAAATIVDAASLDRIFDVHSTTATFAGMTIQGGRAELAGNVAWPNYGGGIYNGDGTLTVNNCVVSGNYAANLGGGIFNGGTLTVTNSKISANSAAKLGGGIYNYNYESLTVSNSTLAGNKAPNGGAIYNNYGTVKVESISVLRNESSSGGGIFNWYGTFTVTSSTLSGNTATFGGGGIANYGTLTISSSTLSGNSATVNGGGIKNSSPGKLTISGSTVLDNTAPAGADLFNTGVIDSISDSTIGVIGP